MISEKKKNSLQYKVYEYIIDGLFKSVFRPGDIIDRQTVSEKLSISTGTVLHAINELEQDGFLITYPRKKTVVREFSLKDLAAHLAIRETLDILAAKIYKGSLLDKSFNRLCTMAEDLDSSRDFNVERIQKDALFHIELIKLTGNRYFINHYSKLLKLSFFYGYDQFKEYFDKPFYNHVQLLEQLHTGKIKVMEKAIRTHLYQGRNLDLLFFKK